VSTHDQHVATAEVDPTTEANPDPSADVLVEGAEATDDAAIDGTADSSAADEADGVVDTDTDTDTDTDADSDADDGDEADGDADGDADDGDEADGDADGGDDAEAPRGAAARLEREGEIAADFLERLLDIADLDGDLDVDVEGERASVAIVDSSEGRVPRRLVGQNGEVLEALQELTRLAVQARTGDRTRLMLDVAGHRARRREELVARAEEAITQVRESGEPLRLEAMNPFERKIVHDAVSAAGLSSSSDGVEPDRRIVVRPAG
jgi:spoIIIJ-associated protein